MYDKEFRTHLNFFPKRSWAISLQQAWSIYLKDRVTQDAGRFNRGGKHRKEVCECYNCGLCTAGRGCKYDHRCKECGKFGHRAHICRKKNNSKEGNANAQGSAGSGSRHSSSSTTSAAK